MERRGADGVCCSGPLGAVEQHVQGYEAYLRQVRGVTDETAGGYVRWVRPFLTERLGTGCWRLSGLRAEQVVRFLEREVARLGLAQAKHLTTALRSFLQYARYRGDVVLDLAAVIPSVASWSMAAIPRAIPPDAVRRLLASMRRRTAIERRDYAVVVLLADLGLRAGRSGAAGGCRLDSNAGRGLSRSGKDR